MTAPTLDELAIARLCHDLISPIGAISNGLELLEDIAGQSPELTLISDSAAAARAKINFFRTAFVRPQQADSIKGQKVEHLIRDRFFNGRISIETVNLSSEMPADLGQLVLLMCLCVESALPLGGAMAMMQDGYGIKITAAGRRVDLTQPLWAHLDQSAPLAETSAPQIHFALAGRILHAAGMTVAITQTDGRLSVTIPNVPAH